MSEAVLLPNLAGASSFLRGISPYSRGVVAAPGFTIEHVRLGNLVACKDGFEQVDAH